MKYPVFIKSAVAIIVSGLILTTSCVKDDSPTALKADQVDASLLIGTWKNDNDANNFKTYTTKGGVYAGTSYGSDWTIGETTEDQEGTEFYWKLEGNKLTELYPNMDGYITRIYTLSKLSSTQLEYFDGADDITSYTKQK